jgi:hypothetical protein
MPYEGALEEDGQTLIVGTDVSVIYIDRAVELGTGTPSDMSGWTVVLDIRKKDTSPAPALISKTGTVSGSYSATPASNTQKVTFALSDDDLSATVFPKDDATYRFSIKRTDTGAEMVLRYGDAVLTRVTQT